MDTINGGQIDRLLEDISSIKNVPYYMYRQVQSVSDFCTILSQFNPYSAVFDCRLLVSHYRNGRSHFQQHCGSDFHLDHIWMRPTHFLCPGVSIRTLR